MEHAWQAQPHGAHPTGRTYEPHPAAPARPRDRPNARQSPPRRGWGLRAAARHAGISFGYLGALERGERAPSTVVAGVLARVYQLDADDSAWLWSGAIGGAGRDYPGRVPRPGGVAGFTSPAAPSQRLAGVRGGGWGVLRGGRPGRENCLESRGLGAGCCRAHQSPAPPTARDPGDAIPGAALGPGQLKTGTRGHGHPTGLLAAGHRFGLGAAGVFGGGPRLDETCRVDPAAAGGAGDALPDEYGAAAAQRAPARPARFHRPRGERDGRGNGHREATQTGDASLPVCLFRRFSLRYAPARHPKHALTS